MEPYLHPRFTVDAGKPGDHIPFDITGVNRLGAPWTERFLALPVMTIASTLALGETLDIGQLVAFLREALIPEHRERFDDLLANPDRLIKAPALWDILSGLLDAMTDRPTSPSPGSPNGAGATGPTSPDGSSSPASSPTLSTAEASST